MDDAAVHTHHST